MAAPLSNDLRVRIVRAIDGGLSRRAAGAKVLTWIDETRDITLVEIAARLAAEGHVFAPATIWRLLDRHDYTVKKRPPPARSRNSTRRSLSSRHKTQETISQLADIKTI